MKQASNWMIGLFAGIAGGLMALAGFNAVTMAAFLLLAAPVTVYIAALGWGPIAGLIAAVVATGISAYGGAVTAIVASGTLLFLPAAWAGHLANLAQRVPVNGGNGGGEAVIWFPLSGILARLMLALAVGFVVTGWAIGFSGDRVAEIFSHLMGEAAKTNPDLTTPAPADLERSGQLYAALVPVVIPAIWLMMHVLVMHFATVVVRRSGRLARPDEDIAATANLPFAMLVMPVAGIAGITLFSGLAYSVSAVLAGIGIAGFGLLGLAELHYVSRGRPGRGFMLFLTYFVLILFSLPLAVLAAIGVRRVLRQNQPRPPAPRPPSRRPIGSGSQGE